MEKKSEPESEEDLILEVSRRLRSREAKIKKQSKLDGLYSPWDADKDFFVWRGAKLTSSPLPEKRVTLEGRHEAVLVGERTGSETGTAFLFSDYIVLCRLSGHSLDMVMEIRKTFNTQRMFLSNQDKSCPEELNYFIEMNSLIQKMTVFFRKRKVANFYEKVIAQVGGTDLLGKRLTDLRNLVEHYKHDKIGWRPEIERLGLIG